MDLHFMVEIRQVAIATPAEGEEEAIVERWTATIPQTMHDIDAGSAFMRDGRDAQTAMSRIRAALTKSFGREARLHLHIVTYKFWSPPEPEIGLYNEDDE